MHIFKNTTFDFLRWRVHAIMLSWLVIIAGIFVFFTKGIPLAIEFAGGTSVIAKFDNQPSIDQVRAAIDKAFPENVIVPYGTVADHQFMVRVPHVGGETGTSLTNTSQQIKDALDGAKIGNVQIVATE